MILLQSVEVETALLFIPPDRQRTDHDISDLLPSVKANGIYNPIIIREDYGVIAGARRFLCAKELKFPTVPVRLGSTLSEIERQIIELEENVRRRDLTWQDEASAFLKLHELYLGQNEVWSITATANSLNVSQQKLSDQLQVAKELRAGNEKILSASGFSAAKNFLSRVRDRKVEDAVADLAETLRSQTPKASPKGQDSGKATPPHAGEHGRSVQESTTEGTNAPRTDNPLSILTADFLEWAPVYSSQPFNLLHCDFPYGVGMHDSDQGKSEKWGSYEDTPEVYWKLIDCLSQNVDRLVANSAHMVFWLSGDILTISQTYDYFRRILDTFFVWPKPLIWHKTDNKGIMQDPQRGPRHVYEVALLASRGDRKILKAVSDVYGCPTDKKFHQSTKPEPMLRHFFSMLVDENTRLLDPTCGSGTALRAAESLGASITLGLEKNPSYAEQANDEMRRFRLLKRAAG